MVDKPASLGDVLGYTDYFEGKGTQNASGVIPADLLDKQIRTVMQNSNVGRGEAAEVVGLGYVKEGKKKGLTNAQIQSQVQNLQKDLIGNTLPMLSNLPRVTTIAEMVAIPLEVIGIGLAVYFGAGIAIIVGAVGILGFTIAQIPKIWYDTNVVAKSQTVQALKFTDEILAGKYDTKPAKLEGFAQEEIDGLFSALQADGITSFIDPVAKQSIALTPGGLNLVIKDAANQLRASGKNPTTAKLLAAVRLMSVGGTSTVAPVASSPKQSSGATSVPTVKVFTGVVVQGKLGEGVAFVERQTDLIDDINELELAAQNNLAPYLAALPAKIVYDIKIVSSVTSKDGFVQRGTTQQIVTGHYANGQPKYKTVTNKFATLDIYILTSKGVKSKIDTITLGPVNAASFSPNVNDLTIAEAKIRGSIVTSDVSQIKTVVSDSPVEVVPTTVVSTTNVASPVTAADYLARYNILLLTNKKEAPGQVFFWERGTTKPNYQTNQVRPISDPTNLGTIGIDVTKLVDLADLPRIPDGNVTQSALYGVASSTFITVAQILQTIDNYKRMEGPISTNPVPASQNGNKCNAVTISDFYGGVIPDAAKLAERAKLYEAWGLGQAAYYTGTAEQNNKWLAEAKRRSGC